MKTYPLALLLLIVSTGYAQKKSKIELIAGIRSGSGYSLLSIVYPGGSHVDSNGNYVASGKYVQQQTGFYIPAKAELLLGVKGFRMGYTFGYTYAKYSSSTLSFRPKTPKVPANTVSSDLLLHSFTHVVKIEYNWTVRIKAAKLLAGLTVGLGGYHGWLNNRQKSIKSDFGIYKNKIVVLAGINLEIVRGPFSIVLSPVYTYQDFQTKQPFLGTVAQHNVGVDVGLRLNVLSLIKPKNEDTK